MVGKVQNYVPGQNSTPTGGVWDLRPWPEHHSHSGESGELRPWPEHHSHGGESGELRPWPEHHSHGGESGELRPWPEHHSHGEEGGQVHREQGGPVDLSIESKQRAGGLDTAS
jgi:hypothetical protein